MASLDFLKRPLFVRKDKNPAPAAAAQSAVAPQVMRINLLDWRSQRRELRKRQFNSMLGLAFVTSVGLVMIVYWFMNNALDHQQSRNDYLRQQITEVDQKIKEIQDLENVKSNLLSRMHVIEELQASRSATVHFFDELVNTLPEGVSLTSVKQSGAGVVIEGIAESNARVSTYMKNLDASPWFEDPKLIVIKTAEKNNLRSSEFTLQVRNLTQPNAQTSDGEEILE
jgi:type IV pilus assembly protein PilN